MKCPYCHTNNDRVVDSRAAEDGYAIRRRRECLSCRRRYTELAVSVLADAKPCHRGRMTQTPELRNRAHPVAREAEHVGAAALDDP